jgi:hypothetical protein
MIQPTGEKKQQDIKERANRLTFLTLFNYMLNRLQRYGIAQSYRILYRVVQRLSERNLKILFHRNI